MLTAAAGRQQNPENVSRDGKDYNTLVISTRTAGADVTQITVNGAFLSSKSLTYTHWALCAFIGLQEAKSLSAAGKTMKCNRGTEKNIYISISRAESISV